MGELTTGDDKPVVSEGDAFTFGDAVHAQADGRTLADAWDAIDSLRNRVIVLENPGDVVAAASAITAESGYDDSDGGDVGV